MAYVVGSASEMTKLVFCVEVSFLWWVKMFAVRCLFEGRVGLCVLCRKFSDGREEGFCGPLCLVYGVA